MSLSALIERLQESLSDASDVKTIILILTGLFAVHFLHRIWRSSRVKEVIPEGAPKSEKDQEKEYGEWTPVKFDYPSFPPCNEELHAMKPIPYRPFRWGAYHVTMGIRDMPWSEWIELDNQYPSYYAIKKHRIHSRGHDVVRVLPDRPGVVRSARHSAVELVHELAGYLTKRYPTTFVATYDSTSNAIKIVKIASVDATLELPPPVLQDAEKMLLRDVSIQEAEEAMRISGLLIQDDLALMVEGTDGRYYFQGGSIVVPGFWRMRDKIGMPLDEIHTSGHVFHYPEKLQISLERFFRRFPVQKPVIRNNYFIQIVKPESHRRTGVPPTDIAPQKEDEDLVDPLELAWSTTTNGNEDTFTHGMPAHPNEFPEVRPETLQFRTERQTLRRLPLTGAIVFTIRTYLVPLPELGKEKGVPARLASAVRSWPEGVGRYKGRDNYETVLLDYLDKCAEEQRRDGGEEFAKWAEKYPY
uniref:Uncharacterized protein n=2 Tax=Moniliophthora roreri TaxID=221103 RepID=A0A0W0G467_MONRR